MKIKEYVRQNKERMPDVGDLLMVVGIMIATKGIYMMYKPAAWVFCGIFLIYLGWPKRK